MYGNNASMQTASASTPQLRACKAILDDMTASGKRLYELHSRLEGLLARIGGPMPQSAAQSGKGDLAAAPSGLASHLHQLNTGFAQLLDQCEQTVARLEEFV